jgi:hypothetical protein
VVVGICVKEELKERREEFLAYFWLQEKISMHPNNG